MLLGLSLAACRNRVCGEAAFGLTDWDQAPDLEAEYEGADVLDDAVDEEGEGWGTDFFDDLDEEGWGFAYRLTATSTGSSTAIRFFAGAFITPDAVLPEGVDLEDMPTISFEDNVTGVAGIFPAQTEEPAFYGFGRLKALVRIGDGVGESELCWGYLEPETPDEDEDAFHWRRGFLVDY